MKTPITKAYRFIDFVNEIPPVKRAELLQYLGLPVYNSAKANILTYARFLSRGITPEIMFKLFEGIKADPDTFHPVYIIDGERITYHHNLLSYWNRKNGCDMRSTIVTISDFIDAMTQAEIPLTFKEGAGK